MNYLDSYPFALPFDYTAVPGATALGLNIVTVNRVLTQGDLLVHGLTTWNAHGVPNFDMYRLSWWDQKYNNRMMTDEISMGAFESDAQYPWRFPIPWVLKRGSILSMQLHNMTATLAGGGAANITAQPVLYGELFPKGYNEPVIEQPWIISLYFNLGFQEDTLTGGNVVNSYNLNCSFSKTMAPLLYDFELHAITVDTLNILNNTNAATFHKLKIADKKTSRLLFDKSAMVGNVAGLRARDVFAGTGLAVPAGFPQDDTLQYILGEPIMFKKDSVVDVHLGMSFLYGPAAGTLSANNGECNVVLIGVKK